MRQRIAAGIGAGLLAGVALALVMWGWPVLAADGRRITMVTYAARLIRVDSPLAGGLAYVVYAGVLGLLFGASLVVGRAGRLRAAMLGAGWGIGWFVVIALGLARRCCSAIARSRPRRSGCSAASARRC